MSVMARKIALIGMMAMCLAGTLAAEDLSSPSGLFANAKEVFPPLRADPREIQISLKASTPVSHTAFGDISAGDYFGLYRWALPWQNSYLQWSLAGGIFSRFDLVTQQKDNEVIDYYGEMPVDLRIGKWSLRALPYHVSSHLGDDYIKRTEVTPQKHALDVFKWLVAYEPLTSLRVYGGSQYIFRNIQPDQARFALQAGLELYSSWHAKGHLQFFAATDYQSWGRVQWNPDTNTQLGVTFARRPEDKQKVSLFTEYGTGHVPYGQFYLQKETRWTLGLRLNLS
jgi:hypothetical protein